MDSKLWILLKLATDQVQKHTKTALDPLEKEGTESSFPVKLHAIPNKTPAKTQESANYPWCKCGAKFKRKIANR